jgi:hypothetical protein
MVGPPINASVSPVEKAEGGDRGIGFGVELEAVLGVEAARLHDVPHERIENRQRQARCGDLRPLLSNRCARPEQDQRRDGRKHGKAAARKRGHGISPPLSCPALIAAAVVASISARRAHLQDIDLARISQRA